MEKKPLCKKHFEQHKKAYKPKIHRYVDEVTGKKGITKYYPDVRVILDGVKDDCFECRVLARVNNACARIGF